MALAIRGAGHIPPELMYVSELRSLGVPLAKDPEDLDATDALAVEDYQILLAADNEARERNRLETLGNR